LPELPEVEAWRRQLDPLVKRSPIEQAGPAHIATLKTFDPPLTALEGEGFRGVERRAKRFLLPTDDDELVLLVHLMSAGRLRYVAKDTKGAKSPIFRVRFVDGGELQLTEAGSKKRAGVWLLRRDDLDRELDHLGPEANELEVDDVARILAADSRRLHSLLRDQRLIAGIGRAWANEILWAARLSPYALSGQLDDAETERLAVSIRDEMDRGLALRLEGANDDRTYRVHDKLGRPCERCGTPIARVDFEEHTIYYCPECQTGGRTLSPYWGMSGRGWEQVQYASTRKTRGRRQP
jgi:formamidopyrimidine-DNA glycosylase